jgi:hypothetical protein
MSWQYKDVRVTREEREKRREVCREIRESIIWRVMSRLAIIGAVLAIVSTSATRAQQTTPNQWESIYVRNCPGV